MKKFFAVFIVCILVMQFTFIPASAEGAEYEPYLKGVQETGSYVGDIEELRYYSFRYTKDASFAWFRENVIGPNHCKEGYLYVKDLVPEEMKGSIPSLPYWPSSPTPTCKNMKTTKVIHNNRRENL